MGEAAPNESFRPAALLAGLWAVCSAIVLVLVYVVRPAPAARPWVVLFDDGARCLLAVLSSAACLRRARRSKPALVASWRWLSAAFAALSLGMVWLVVVVDLLERGPPWSLVRHVGYLLHLVLIARALLAWPTVHGLPSQRLRSLLDGLMISAALFFIAWGAFLRDLVQSRAEYGGAYALTVVYPVGATALAALWLFQDARMPLPPRPGARTVLRLAVLLLVVHHVLYAIFSINGAARTFGSGELFDVFTAADIVLFGLAALWPAGSDAAQQLPGRASEAQLLPFAPSAIALLFAVVMHACGEPFDEVQTATGLALVVVLFGRQFITLRDLDQLSTDLEQRVEQRTAELTQRQGELLRGQRAHLVAGLAAGLAHDVKNLLTVGLTWARVLQESHSEADLAEGLGAIEESTLKATRLVQQVLAAGHQQEFHPSDFELESFVSERLPVLRGVVEGRAQLQATLEPGLTIRMDPEHLQLTLLNLVGNAADAMVKPGTIALRAERDPLEPFALLRVIDDGSGMPPEVVAQIFEPFFTTKAPGKGSGLGLASVQSVLWQSGGSIEVESAPDRGTTFTLRLPLAERTGAPAAPAQR